MQKENTNNDILLGHSECFECGSSDAMACYADHSYCFSCGKRFTYNETTRVKPVVFVERGKVTRSMSGNKSVTRSSSGAAKGLPPKSLVDRCLSKATLEKYGVTLGYNDKGEVVEHFYPYTNNKNELVASKIRLVETKEFKVSGNLKEGTLFGQSLVKAGGKYLTITEGEIDAMSVYEMMGYPAVSVKSATSAYKDVQANYEFVNSFETVVICFDNDEPKKMPDGSVRYPGQEAAEQVATLFKAGKVKILDCTPYKDANDYLKAGKTSDFSRAWYSARKFAQDGIVCGDSLWDIVSKEEEYEMIPYPYVGMNKRLFGLRTSEMITVTAGTGVGKTTLLKHLAVHIKDITDESTNVGMLMLEETLRESSRGLMSVAAKVPLHLPDNGASPEEIKRAFDETLGTGRFFFHDHFGSTSIDNIVDKVDKLAVQYGCKYIILDHISIVVSDQENGDERRALDEIATKLKTLTISKNICLIIVCHLKRIAGKPAEEGGQISLADIRGTAGIGQLSNVVLALERDLQSKEQLTTIRVLKDRFAGRTGIACQLKFDYNTYSFNEVEEEDPEKVSDNVFNISEEPSLDIVDEYVSNA